MINVRNQEGFSLFEMLVSLFIVSIMIIGLMNLHSSLMKLFDHSKKLILAENSAFELLDNYPDLINIELPKNWKYEFKVEQYSDNCRIVSVYIHSLLEREVNQKRMFCND